jgi:hypothetical protein
MLRATVYTVVAGVPLRRDIVELPVDSVLVFKGAVTTRVLAGGGAPPGAVVEFGPVGEPWRRMERSR